MTRAQDRTKTRTTERKLLLTTVIVLSSFAMAQNRQVPGVRNVRVRREVLVSIPDRKLAVIENGTVLSTFRVAVGARISPSPVGEFHVVSRLSNPTYYHSGIVIPPGKDNPIGPRWLGLNRRGYGIHGTNDPHSVGRAASHGCIRLRNRDIERLYEMVRVEDVVDIRAQRDEETARIFGGVPDSNASLMADVRLATSLAVQGQ